MPEPGLEIEPWLKLRLGLACRQDALAMATVWAPVSSVSFTRTRVFSSGFGAPEPLMTRAEEPRYSILRHCDRPGRTGSSRVSLSASVSCAVRGHPWRIVGVE
jgi:hypothetical protein